MSAAAESNNISAITPATVNLVDRFNGSADAQAWLGSLEDIAGLYGWDDATCLKVAKVRLGGAASTWSQRRRFQDWQQFQDQFLARFGETRESAIARLERCRQSAGETPQAFADRFLQDADRAGRVEDDALVYTFIQRLHSDLRIEVSRRQPASIEEVVSFCNYWLGCQPGAADHKIGSFKPQNRYRPDYEDTDYTPKENRPPFNRNAAGGGRFEPRNRPRPDQERAQPYRPQGQRSFRDNFGNRNSPMTNLPTPPAATPSPAPAVKPPGPADVDDLASKFGKLQLNSAQQLRDKDREIRHLKYALQQQMGQSTTEMNLFQPSAYFGDNNNDTGSDISFERADSLETPTEQLLLFNPSSNMIYPQQQHLSTTPEMYATSSNAQTLAAMQPGEATNDDHDGFETMMLPAFLTPTQQAENFGTMDLSAIPEEPNMSMFDPQEDNDTTISPEFLGQLLASLYTKRPAEEPPTYYKKMPHKRVAIEPNQPSPYSPNNRPGVAAQTAPPPPERNSEGALDTPTFSKRMPRQRIPIRIDHPAVRTTEATPNRHQPLTNRNAAVDKQPLEHRSSSPSAANIADEKGREIADSLCKKLSLDGNSSQSVPPRALLTCVAGHLTGDEELIQLGRDMAKKTQELLNRYSPGSRLTKQTNIHVAQPQPGARPDTNLYSISRSKRYGGPQCTLPVKIGDYETIALVDTGASASAMSLDCMRRAGMLDLINTNTGITFTNADGSRCHAKGRAYRVPLSLGSLTTMFSPTITNALSYDMLLGNDVLTALNAKIDMGNGQIEIRIDPDHTQVLDLHLIPAGAEHSISLCSLSTTDQPILSNIQLEQRWQTFMDAAYSLPPKTPNEPGWQRRNTSLDHQLDNLEYKKWMADRQQRMINAVEPLLQVYDQSLPADPDRVMIKLIQADGTARIRSGMTDDGANRSSRSSLRMLTPSPFSAPKAWHRAIYNVTQDLATTVYDQLALDAVNTDNPDGSSFSFHYCVGNEDVEAFHYPPMEEDLEPLEEPAPSTFNDLFDHEFGWKWWQYIKTTLTMPPEATYVKGWTRTDWSEDSLQHLKWTDVTHLQDWTDRYDKAVFALRMQLEYQYGPQLKAAGIITLMNSLELIASNRINWDHSQAEVIQQYPEYLLAAGLLKLGRSIAGEAAFREAMAYISKHTPTKQSADLGEGNTPATHPDDEDNSSCHSQATAISTTEDPTTLQLDGDARPSTAATADQLLHYFHPIYYTPDADWEAGDLPLDPDAVPTSHSQGWTEDEQTPPTEDTESTIEDTSEDSFSPSDQSTDPTAEATEDDDLSELLAILMNPYAEIHTTARDILHQIRELCTTTYAASNEFMVEPLHGPSPDGHVDDNSDNSRPAQLLTFNTTSAVDDHPALCTFSNLDSDAPMTAQLQQLSDDEGHNATDDIHLMLLHPDDPVTFTDDGTLDSQEVCFDQMLEGTDLDPAERQQVEDFLQLNADVFCWEPHQLGCCTLATHVIDTGDAPPVRQGYYRMPYKKHEQMRQHVRQLLDLGIIRPSNSPWASPAHLVPKKDGSTRMVINYQKVNNLTRKDAYPLPRIDDLLNNIGPARWLSVADAWSGYLQVPLSPESVAKSAFVTADGLWEYTRMPFGLTSAPATYQRIMQTMLIDLIAPREAHTRPQAAVFLDDCLMWAETVDKHLKVLDTFFESLRRAKMKLNPAKTKLFQSQLVYLGHVVDCRTNTITTDPRLVQAIKDRIPPRSKRELASWLGLANYYRKFSPNHSKICLPLTRLLAKDTPYTWGPEQQEAFDIIKTRLTSYPTLRRPDLSRPFIVHTDASTQAIGAILAQKDENNREYVVAYHSKKLTPAQTKWPVAELECYAVYNAVCEAFSDFLYGADSFELYTDCICLKWLFTAKNLKPRLQRYNWALSEYPGMHIIHRKGTAHRNVDALTRDPTFDLENEDELSTEDNTPTFRYSTHLNTFTPSCEDETAAQHLTNPETDLIALATPTAPSTQEPQRDEPSSSAPALWRLSDIQPLRIYIDGNIGSGKTTVIDHLTAHLPQTEWLVIPEPVSAWQPLLGPFYEASADSPLKPHAAALLQIAVLMAYTKEVPDFHTAPKVVMERGPWSSLEVFLKAQHLPHHLERLVYDVADCMWPMLGMAQPDAIIYLDCPPDTCLQRIKQRQHEGEKSVKLEYLQLLDDHYKKALQTFAGQVIPIDATQPPSEVAEQVLKAVQSLTSTCLATPARSNLDNQALFMLHNPQEDEHAPGPMAPPPPPLRPVPPPQPLPGSQYYYAAVPLHLIYDPLLEVPVLFQSGPGTFNYSEAFKAEYLRRYGTPVVPHHRINNIRALDVYTALSPWISNGPTANIQIAVVPLKAKYAIKVKTIHSNGSEAVYVDTESYADIRYREASTIMPEILRLTPADFSWLNSFKNEGFTLDGWIRIVRPRPLLQSGLQLSGSTIGRNPGAVIPVTLEQGNTSCSAAIGPVQLRLVSNLPYHPGGGITQPPAESPPTTQLNMFNTTTERAKRTCTTNQKTPNPHATQSDSDDPDYTAPSNELTDSGPSVDPDLPCKICKATDNWDRMLLCSKCNNGYHTFCLGLSDIPKDDWYCLPCKKKGKYKATYQHEEDVSNDSPDPTSEDEDLWSGDDDTARDFHPLATTSTFKEIMDDEPVIHYLRTGTIQLDHLHKATSSNNKAETKRIKKRAHNYRWHPQTNSVYKTATARWPTDRLVVPPGPKRIQLIEETHAELGHLGIRKVCSLLQTRYYWKNMTADVQTQLKQCDECMRTKTLFKQQPELQCLPPAKIWDRVHVDTLGPLASTRLHRNRYLFVACCAGSKYLEARAFKEATTENWCSFLADIFSRWGTCHTIVSDNATYYTSPEMQGFLHSVGVQHRFTNSYSPQSNGQAEAAVKCLLNSLQRSVGNTPDCWDEKLPWVLLGLRSAKHTTTGFSPLFVMSGRHAVLPSERRQQLEQEKAAAQTTPSITAPKMKEEPNHPQTTLPPTPTTEDVENPMIFLEAFPVTSQKPRSTTECTLPTTMPRSPVPPFIDLTMDPPEDENTLDKATQAFMDLRQKNSEQVQTLLERNILLRQEKQKRDFKKRHFNSDTIPKLKVGSLVLMKNPSAQRTKLHKGLACEGPYRLVELLPTTNPTTAILEDAHHRRWSVSVKRLALYPLAAE